MSTFSRVQKPRPRRAPSIRTRRPTDAQKTTEHRHRHRSRSRFDSPRGHVSGCTPLRALASVVPARALLHIHHRHARVRIRRHPYPRHYRDLHLLVVHRDTEETLGEECYVIRPHRLDAHKITLWTRSAALPPLPSDRAPNIPRHSKSYTTAGIVTFPANTSSLNREGPRRRLRTATG